MKDSNYIVVMSWMMTRLGLSGNELLAYALIYSYSQDSQGCYFGSLAHTATRLNISRRAAVDVLNRLVDKGHLTKKNIEVDGVQRCIYKAVAPVGIDGAPPAMPRKKTAPLAERPPAGKKPTLEEVKEYCATRGNIVDAQRFFDFYEANGWVQGTRGKPIKDWRAAVRTWERLNNNYSHGQRNNKESIILERRADICREVAELDAEFLARKAAGVDAQRVLEASQPGSRLAPDKEQCL